MKYLIVLLLCLTVFSQEITSTKQYDKLIDQAEAEYKASVAKAKKIKDAKVLRVFKMYVAALEDAKAKAMKAGDLDRANKLNKEIVNLQAVVTEKPATYVEERVTHPAVGTWIFSNNQSLLLLKAGGKAYYHIKHKGTWTVKGDILTLRWDSGNWGEFKVTRDKMVSVSYNGRPDVSGAHCTKIN